MRPVIMVPISVCSRFFLLLQNCKTKQIGGSKHFFLPVCIQLGLKKISLADSFHKLALEKSRSTSKKDVAINAPRGDQCLFQQCADRH